MLHAEIEPIILVAGVDAFFIITKLLITHFSGWKMFIFYFPLREEKRFFKSLHLMQNKQDLFFFY